MMQRTYIWALSVMVLTACGLPGTTSVPTAFPADYVPTAVYLTAVSIDAATQAASKPTATATATNTFVPPTLAPTLTPTPGPQVPLSAIQVRSPGPMSPIVSPVQVHLLAIAGESKRVAIDLFGEDGRLLGRSLIAVPGSALGDALSVKIPFEIRGPGESGFVQVSTKNASGRVQSLVTVPVLLLSAGVSQINPPGNTVYERVALVNLPAEAEISGGVLEVVGEVLPYNNSPVIMELISEAGDHLSLRVLDLPYGDWQAVDTTLPYKVSSTTTARLFVRQADKVIDGDAYVFSQLITLNP